VNSKLKKVTIKEVAQLAGVSVSTVSNYLNKRYNTMSSTTKDKIQNSVAKLEYYPSIGASSLPRNYRTQNVAIIIPQNIDFTFHHPYFADVMGGLSETLEQYEYRAMIIVGGKHNVDDLNYLKTLSHGIVDGFIFFDVNNNDIFVKSLSNMEIPIMVVGKNPCYDSNYVDTDIVSATKRGVLYLGNRDKRKILLINGPKDMVFSNQTLTGYKEGLDLIESEYDESLIYSGEFSFEFGHKVGEKVFKKFDLDKMAVYSASGQTTIGFMKAANEMGIDINRIKIINFGENPSMSSLYPYLPYIKQQKKYIGRSVGEKLITMIRQGTFKIDPIVFQTQLIIPKK